MQLLQQSRNLEFLSITSIYNVGVLPPNKRDKVCSAFVDVVDRETNAAQCRLLVLQRVKANKMITGLYGY